MRTYTPNLLPFLFAFAFTFCACKKEKVTAVEVLTDSTGTAATNSKKPAEVCCKTENVIIVVVDGPRFSETWGDDTRQNIPQRYSLYSKGVMLDDFKNNGLTYTGAGHAAISTGVYEELENYGQQLPLYPSIFQSFLKSTGKPADKAWIITSKDKLQMLANCVQSAWAGKYMPRTDCGNFGLFSGYREDDTTVAHTKSVMQTYHPNLMLINFKDPDYWGHSDHWKNYIDGIKSTDAYIKEIYELIQADGQYKDKTTLIVTNDHGRHLDRVSSGFIDHGDDCEGCRHIEFFALGPDFKKGVGLHTPYEQIDISATVAKLLNFKMEYSQGKVINEIFQ